MGDYDEGNSYNWSQWKQFNSDMILGLYIRKLSIEEMKDDTYYEEQLSGNLSILCAEIDAHPETTFKISVPPYSMLWWDNVYRNGDTESYLYNLEKAMEKLLTYDNVELYYFLNDREVVTNLENYMDILHFSPEINRYMCDSPWCSQFHLDLLKWDRLLLDHPQYPFCIVLLYLYSFLPNQLKSPFDFLINHLNTLFYV